MLPSDDQNPFESPVHGQKRQRDARFYVGLARYGWLLPLVGMGLTASSAVVSQLDVHDFVALVPLAAAALCWLGGCIVTLWTGFKLSHYQAMLRDLRKSIVWLVLAAMAMVLATLLLPA